VETVTAIDINLYNATVKSALEFLKFLTVKTLLQSDNSNV